MVLVLLALSGCLGDDGAECSAGGCAEQVPGHDPVFLPGLRAERCEGVRAAVNVPPAWAEARLPDHLSPASTPGGLAPVWLEVMDCARIVVEGSTLADGEMFRAALFVFDDHGDAGLWLFAVAVRSDEVASALIPYFEAAWAEFDVQTYGAGVGPPLVRRTASWSDGSIDVSYVDARVAAEEETRTYKLWVGDGASPRGALGVRTTFHAGDVAHVELLLESPDLHTPFPFQVGVRGSLIVDRYETWLPAGVSLR